MLFRSRAEAHRAAREIEHPQPRLGRGPRVVDQREDRTSELALCAAARVRAQRLCEWLRGNAGGREPCAQRLASGVERLRVRGGAQRERDRGDRGGESQAVTSRRAGGRSARARRVRRCSSSAARRAHTRSHPPNLPALAPRARRPGAGSPRGRDRVLRPRRIYRGCRGFGRRVARADRGAARGAGRGPARSARTRTAAPLIAALGKAPATQGSITTGVPTSLRLARKSMSASASPMQP